MFDFTEQEKRALLVLVTAIFLGFIVRAVQARLAGEIKPSTEWEARYIEYGRELNAKLNKFRRLAGVSVADGEQDSMRVEERRADRGAAPGHHTKKREVLTKPINVNTADETELQKLPGVGPVLARRIVELRRKKRGYKAVSDLLEVKGIGKKSFKKMRSWIILKSSTPPMSEGMRP